MKGKKGLFLFFALLMPVFVFLFLKIFGKNEFAVKPLYQQIAPEVYADCPVEVPLPYHIPDSVLHQINFNSDSLVVIWFAEMKNEPKRIYDKVEETYPLKQILLKPAAQKTKRWQRCVFFLNHNYDMILLDKHGFIRGQYASNNREEIDRLFIELDIILKRY